LNDQNVGDITPGNSCKTNYLSDSLTHDIIVDMSYPLGEKATAGLSYNSTMTSDFESASFDVYQLPQFGSNFSHGGSSYAGQFERFSSLHGSLQDMIARNVSAQVSLYVNQYQYHVPSVTSTCNNQCSQSQMSNFYSY